MEENNEQWDYNLDLGFEPEMFDFDFSTDEELKPRILKPKTNAVKESQVMFSNAKKLAKEIDLRQENRYDVIVSGNFIFGDFIEALLVHYNIKCTELTITTLSLSQDNVDSLELLLDKGYIDKLNIIVSVYFFAHEQKNLIPYLYEKLDKDNRFQLAVAAIHTKTVQMHTLGGKKIVIHGSANLRSSGNIEQFTVEINDNLYDFYQDMSDKILDKYKTIDKTAIRDKELWETLQRKRFND